MRRYFFERGSAYEWRREKRGDGLSPTRGLRLSLSRPSPNLAVPLDKNYWETDASVNLRMQKRSCENSDQGGSQT